MRIFSVTCDEKLHIDQQLDELTNSTEDESPEFYAAQVREAISVVLGKEAAEQWDLADTMRVDKRVDYANRLSDQ